MFEGAAGELRARLLGVGTIGRNVLVTGQNVWVVGRPQVLRQGLAELRTDACCR